MTRVHIHGIGACAMGHDEPFAAGIGRLLDVPIKDHATPAARRRYGQVARMVRVAAARAISNAGVEDPSTLAVVSATAMGEVKVSLDLLQQIKENRGAPISPSLVPNAVHNASAGHLTIALSSKAPAVTVSQGWLCAEAAIAAATDLLVARAATRVLVVLADEADPQWVARLESANAGGFAKALLAEAFQEGGAAMILGLEPGGLRLGSLEAGVERGDRERARAIAAAFSRFTPEVRLRTGAGASALAADFPRASVDGPGLGTSSLGAAAILMDRMRDPACASLLLFGREADDLGWLHWAR